MIVIADTGPINYIVQLGLLSELQAIYGSIILPQAVFDELRNPRAPSKVKDWTSSLPDWVEVRKPRLADPHLPGQLGAGETEAINLAIELNAGMLLIDDLPGRRAAHERGIPVTGTLTIIVQAAILSSFDLEPVLQQLRSLGFRVSDAVLDSIRHAYRAIRSGQQ